MVDRPAPHAKNAPPTPGENAVPERLPSFHSYAIWDANSTLTLCNVPWDSGYDNFVSFPDTAALDAYIDAIPNEDKRVITNGSYVRANEPVLVEDPFNTVSLYNYLRVSQPPQPTTPAEPLKHYYYFITQVTHIAPNTTALSLQLDVMQTYFRAAKLGRCYVERGHVARAQTVQGTGIRSLTEPEGLAVGEEYYIAFEHLAPAITKDSYDIMLVSTIDLYFAAFWGTPEDPKIPVSRGSKHMGIPNGLSILMTSEDLFQAGMKILQDYPWIAQGIIGIYLIPKLTRYYDDVNYGESTPDTPFGGVSSYRQPDDRELNFLGDWRDYLTRETPTTIDYGESQSVFVNQYYGRYSKLAKFWTSPYTLIEITADSGNSLVFRPEYMGSDDLRFRERFSAHLGALGINYYLPENGYAGASDFQDMFVMTGSLPSLGFVNDAGALAVSNSTYSRAFASSAASTQLSNANAATGASYRLADAGQTNMRNQARNSNITGGEKSRAQRGYNTDMMNLQNQYSVATNIGGGIVGGLAAGGIKGGAAGLVGGIGNQILGTSQRSDVNNVQNGLIQEMNSISVDSTQRSYESARAYSEEAQSVNYNLANQVNQANYDLAIAGIESQRQTAELTPPSMQGQLGGDLLRVATTGMGLRVRVKTTPYVRVQQIGEYWFRYGYACNRFFTPPRDLHVMSKFSYWKMTEATIERSEMPETFKNTIRGALQKGVTVWHDPDDIGTIDPADNDAIIKDYYGITS